MSHTYRNTCRTPTGTASRNWNTGTGTNAESMNRNRTRVPRPASGSHGGHNDQGLQRDTLEALYHGYYVVALTQVWSNFSDLRADAGIIRQDAPQEAAPPPRRTRVTAGLRTEVVHRYTAGQPSQLIAEDLHIGKATVLKILRAAGVSIKPVGVHY